jgi:hypothetical protein
MNIEQVVYTQLGAGGLLLLILVAAFWKIHSDLTRMRVEIAYQLNRDLLARRFDSYGELWSRMQTLALYAGSGFGPSDARSLGEKLSEWYFSAHGGIFLTKRAREFYFALQDLVQVASALPGWHCARRPATPEDIFILLLTELGADDACAREAALHLSRHEPEALDEDRWRRACRSVAGKLGPLAQHPDPEAGQAIFASLQQASSILRSHLTFELRSRLDVKWPMGRRAMF